MMRNLNRIRNSANAQHLLSTISDNLDFEYVERFKLDWDLYKGEMPSEITQGKFKLLDSSV